MLQSLFKRNSKRTFDLARSFLFTRQNRGSESELVLTNNAGIFGACWAIHNHSVQDHSNLHVVCFPFWMDKFRLHDRHKMNNFGQSLLGFPTIVRSIFKKLYPNYPIDKLVTFGMIQEARDFTMDDLKQKGVNLHDLREAPYPIDYNGLFEIKTKDTLQLCFQDQGIVTVPLDTEIYNWLKVPRLHNIPSLPERPHTELYTLSPEKVPSTILVMGDGVSVVWLKRDFPNSTLIAIVPDHHNDFPDVPTNKLVKVDEILKIKVDDIVSIDAVEIIIQPKNGRKQSIPISNFFSAIGYTPYQQLTALISDKQKTDRIDIIPDSWVAGKNIPVGSLAQSLMKFFEETENLEDSFELQFYHTPCIVDVLKKHFHDQCNIDLQEVFFDQLKINIQKNDSPLDEQGELDLFTRTFVGAQSPSDFEINAFRSAIQEFQHNRQLKINTPSFYGENNSPLSSIRHFSTIAYGNHAQGNLTPEIRLAIKNLVSVFFNPEKEKVKRFDEEQLKLKNVSFSDEDRAKMKSALKEADNSKKTFSAY